MMRFLQFNSLIKHLHFHFSAVNYNNKGELNHLNLGEGGPYFEPLAKEVLKRKLVLIVCVIRLQHIC